MDYSYWNGLDRNDSFFGPERNGLDWNGLFFGPEQNGPVPRHGLDRNGWACWAGRAGLAGEAHMASMARWSVDACTGSAMRGMERNGAERICLRTGTEHFFGTDICLDRNGMNLFGPDVFLDRTGMERNGTSLIITVVSIVSSSGGHPSQSLQISRPISATRLPRKWVGNAVQSVEAGLSM
jgi:hypothetical protein